MLTLVAIVLFALFFFGLMGYVLVATLDEKDKAVERY